MSSRSRTAEREAEGRLNLRTLAIASAASAAAALLTSQLWIAGTWIAAAMTPVIVSLVSEVLTRPTERIAKSFTSDRRALPAAGGPGRPPGRGADPLPDLAPMDPPAEAGQARPPVPGPGSEAPIRVYRAGQREPLGSRAGGRRRQLGGPGPQRAAPGGPGGRAATARAQGIGGHSRDPRSGGPVLGAPGMPSAGGRPVARRRKIAYGAVFATAALAFVIAMVALTVPELVAGGSVGKNDGRTTLFGGKTSDDRSEEQAPQDTTTEEQQRQQQTEEEPQPTTPEEETAPPPEEEPPAEEAQPRQAPVPAETVPETTPAPPTTQP